MQPLIDPRLGDAEDDVSSPKSRSLLAVAGSLFAEISLAKLALALAVLVVLPGTLVGLLPLLATVWAATLTGQLRAPLGFLPLLVIPLALAIGWFGAGRLFRAAERSFWSLNALAVQPGYALFREALRHLVERLLARGRPPPARLARVRAATAAGAGLLLCAIALLVAVAVWPSTRWVGSVGDLADPLRLVLPALANTAFVLSAYLAGAAVIWGIGDSLMPQPMGLDRFDEPPAAARRWRVAHLSDLHMVAEPYGFRLESGRAGPRGNDRALAALARVAAIDASAPLDLVLITGDMTDAGRSGEWAAFLDALAAQPALRARTLVLPGNHDVNVVDRANPARLDLPMSPSKRLRQMRALSAIAAVQGERVHVVDRERRRLGPTLAEVLAPRAEAIRAFADTGARAPARGLARLWDDVFPLVLPPAVPDGLGVALLNSNAETHFSFTNALGLVPERQADRLAVVFDAWPRARWVVALHHHLVEYPRPVHALSERIGTVLVNGSRFVQRLRHYRERSLAMHGHRHLDWIGSCGGLRIISAPSPVMTPGAGDFYIHTLAAAAGTGLALLPPERIPLEATTAA